jgi:hypothetical protein
MSEFAQASGFEYVILVDRTGLGGVEIIHDGVRITFKPGQHERPVPLFLAEWLARVDQHKVHTKDGDWVSRFGVRDAPQELIARVGEMDDSPIEIDTSRLEGWNSDQYTHDRGDRVEVKQLRRNPQDYANVATPGTFGKER